MRPPEPCSKNRSEIISVTRVTTVLLQFLPLHSWRQEHERSHTLASQAPHLQRPAAEGVTAHLCHHQFLRNIPVGKAPEQMQFSIWCPNDRNKAFALLHVTLAFTVWRKRRKKKKSYPNWSKCQFQAAAFLKIHTSFRQAKMFHKHTQTSFWTHYINVEEELLEQRQN